MSTINQPQLQKAIYTISSIHLSYGWEVANAYELEK